MGIMHQLHLISRSIDLRGKACIFYRVEENEFGETEGEQKIAECKGLFHSSNGFLNIEIAEAGRVYAQTKPKLLISYTDKIVKEDVIELEGARYRVIGMDDPGNLHLCLDLSLEVM